MSPNNRRTLEKKLRKSTPHSRMVVPASPFDKAKYLFWRLYTPCHPYVRDAAHALHIVGKKGRQLYLLGTLAPGVSIEGFVEYLIGQGFGRHHVSYKEEGEVASLRRVEGFTHQYHLRVFEDGEVRAHYELTPECYPISHALWRDMEPRREEFLQMLGDRIIPSASA